MERAGQRLRVPCPVRRDALLCRLVRLDRDRAAHERRLWMRDAAIPPRYRGADIERVAPQVREDVRAYLDRLAEHIGKGHGLVITGDTGVGKSSVMGLVADRACELSMTSVHWAHATDIFTAVCDRDTEEGRQLWAWRTCRLLLVDEFAGAYMHAFPLGRFEAFMEARHGQALTTCLTMNLLVEDLERAREIARLVDRWGQTCYVLEIRGPSQRQPLEGTP